MAACSRSVRRASPELRQARRSSAPIIDIAPTPSGGGYWLAGADGSVLAFGDAGSFGSLAGGPVPNPVVALDGRRPTVGGYWMLTAEGGVFTFGSAGFFGSLPGVRGERPSSRPARPATRRRLLDRRRSGRCPSLRRRTRRRLAAVGQRGPGRQGRRGAVMPTGGGYWLASLAGGVYTFGDADEPPRVSDRAWPTCGRHRRCTRRRGLLGRGERRIGRRTARRSGRQRACHPRSPHEARLLDGPARRADRLADEPGRHGVPEVQRTSPHRRR